MPQYVITPWKYHHELLRVRRELYQLGDCAPPIDLRHHAIDWIAAWKLRGNLPHAVESTSHLVDAVLHHSASKNSTFSIRATYVAAFSRFVTGFCDIGQDAAVKRSMYDVAYSIDMPASFVELRHDATHGELPSLKRLEKSAQLALDWLWQYYWVKLDGDAQFTTALTVPKQTTPLPSMPELRTLLSLFLKQRKAEIKADPRNAARHTSAHSASAKASVEIIKICLGRKAALLQVAAVLVNGQLLIPNRSIGDSMKGAFQIWGNLLRRLAVHQQQFLRVMVEQLMAVIAKPSHLDVKLDVFREAVYEWLAYILTDTPWLQSKLGAQVIALRDHVINECVLEPSHWPVLLAQKVLEHSDALFKKQWAPFVELCVQHD